MTNGLARKWDQHAGVNEALVQRPQEGMIHAPGGDVLGPHIRVRQHLCA